MLKKGIELLEPDRREICNRGQRRATPPELGLIVALARSLNVPSISLQFCSVPIVPLKKKFYLMST